MGFVCDQVRLECFGLQPTSRDPEKKKEPIEEIQSKVRRLAIYSALKHKMFKIVLKLREAGYIDPLKVLPRDDKKYQDLLCLENEMRASEGLGKKVRHLKALSADVVNDLAFRDRREKQRTSEDEQLYIQKIPPALFERLVRRQAFGV